MFKFRPQRRLLAEAMEEVVEFETREALESSVKEELGRWGITDPEVSIEPYGYDKRIGWDTQIVTVKGYGVFGFTDRVV